jgi:hypothetical protein
MVRQMSALAGSESRLPCRAWLSTRPPPTSQRRCASRAWWWPEDHEHVGGLLRAARAQTRLDLSDQQHRLETARAKAREAQNTQRCWVAKAPPRDAGPIDPEDDQIRLYRMAPEAISQRLIYAARRIENELIFGLFKICPILLLQANARSASYRPGARTGVSAGHDLPPNEVVAQVAGRYHVAMRGARTPPKICCQDHRNARWATIQRPTQRA